MKKVFQTIIDPCHGNCMQAAIASLFDKELDIMYKELFEKYKIIRE